MGSVNLTRMFFRVRSNLARFCERLVNLAFTGQILFRFSGYSIKFDEKDTQPNAAKIAANLQI